MLSVKRSTIQKVKCQMEPQSKGLQEPQVKEFHMGLFILLF